MVMYILISNAKTLLELFCNSNCIHLCSYITLSSSSNENIVEWLIFMSAVRLFVGSACIILFGLACKDYTFDRSAFNVGYFFKKFRVYVQGVCLSSGLEFTFRV